MNIALRVDASASMGTGHLARCLALAHALRALGAKPHFVMRDLQAQTTSRLQAAGFDMTVLPVPREPWSAAGSTAHAAWAGVEQERDAEQTVQALAGLSPAWVVVDHYAFDATWHRLVAGGLGCRIAAIDDLADRALDVSMLVDPNLTANHREKFRGLVSGLTAVLGGPRYALLGPDYANAQRYQASDTVRSIGIFMGGSDAPGHSLMALSAVQAAGFQGEVEVVTTSANPGLRALREAVATRAGTSLCVDLPSLAPFFARHDLHIGAGGGSTWERCCIGAPALVLQVASNQAAVVPQLAALGAIATLPQGLKPETRPVAQVLERLLTDVSARRRLTQASAGLVDGHGAARVALALLAELLRVRPAREVDGHKMFVWRNHPDTRAASRQAQAIDPADHAHWLVQALADPDRQFLMGEIGSRPVGVVRFDKLSRVAVEVSIYLDPELHGLGLGRALLAAGEAALSEGAGPELEFIEATVLQHNSSSRRLFERAGYIQSCAERWRKVLAGHRGGQRQVMRRDDRVS